MAMDSEYLLIGAFVSFSVCNAFSVEILIQLEETCKLLQTCECN